MQSKDNSYLDQAKFFCSESYNNFGNFTKNTPTSVGAYIGSLMPGDSLIIGFPVAVGTAIFPGIPLMIPSFCLELLGAITYMGFGGPLYEAKSENTSTPRNS